MAEVRSRGGPNVVRLGTGRKVTYSRCAAARAKGPDSASCSSNASPFAARMGDCPGEETGDEWSEGALYSALASIDVSRETCSPESAVDPCIARRYHSLMALQDVGKYRSARVVADGCARVPGGVPVESARIPSKGRPVDESAAQSCASPG